MLLCSTALPLPSSLVPDEVVLLHVVMPVRVEHHQLPSEGLVQRIVR
ncbi:MAG: hypothetical protein U5Q44_11520 [Dehalococcoidia bacterium]|nr:hypothetical protein [Dehalococcoidia bacterium]